MNQTPSDTLFDKVRRDVLASMETGNFDRARLVIQEYTAVAQANPALVDRSDDLKADVVAAYGVGI